MRNALSRLMLGVVLIAVGAIARHARRVRCMAGNHMFLGRPVAQIDQFAAL